jgi:hypothetical protein
MEISFCVHDWAAWAPGLEGRAAWQAWAAAPELPSGDGVAELPEVPALQRRRLSRLGRAVLQVAIKMQRDRPGMPMVFSSRYGDVERALKALADLEDGEPLSPTVFAGSVHNAIGAMHSINGDQRQNLVCVAAGAANAAAGLTEAAGLLADGADEVLLACYDEPLPPAYTPFAEDPQTTYAWAWRVGHAGGAAETLSLSRRAAVAGDQGHVDLPGDLAVLQWLLSGKPCSTQTDGDMAWHWSRHG